MRENSPRSKKKQNKAMSAGMRFAAGLLVTLFVFNALSLPAFTEEIPESPPDDGYEYVLTDTEVSPEGAEVEEDSPEEGTEGNTEGIQDSTEGIDGAKDVPFSPEATENIPEGVENTPESGEAVPDVTADVPQVTEDMPMLAATDFGIAPMAIDIRGYSSDLADFLTSVVIKNANGDVIGDGGAVHVGETYDLEFSFKEVPDTIFARQFKYNENNSLTYQLPAGVTVPTAHSGKITGSEGDAELGEYGITAAGAVTANFKKVDKYGSTVSENFIDYYTNATFTLKLEAKFTAGSGGGGVEIKFGDNVIIHLTVDSNPSLSVTKTAGNYDPKTRTIAYIVKVTAHNGTVNNITLTDIMNISAPNWKNIPVGMLSINGNALVNSTEVTPTKNADNKYSIQLENVMLNDGQSATVTYSVRVSDELFENTNNNYSSNTYNLNNTVTANGKSSTPSDVTAEAKASSQFTVTHLSKGGSLSQDGKNITWTVRAGDGFTDLRGAKITDALVGSNQTIQVNTIQVTLYADAAATNIINTYTNNSTPTAGSLLTGQPVAGFTLNVPDDSTVSTAVKRVVIKYTSTIAGSQLSYSNEVSLQYKGKQNLFNTDASVSGVDMGAKKTGVLKENGDIEYTISMIVPGDMKGHVLMIEDLLLFLPFGKTDFENDSVAVDNKPMGMTVDIEKTDGTLLTPDEQTKWEWINGDHAFLIENNVKESPEPHTWYILFNAPRFYGTTFPDLSEAKWKIGVDSVVTVKYTIPHDAKVLGDGEYAGMTLAQALNYGTLINVANISVDGSDDPETVFAPLCKPIIKSGKKTYEYQTNRWYTEGSTGYGSNDDNFYGTNAPFRKGFSYTVELNPYPDGIYYIPGFAGYNLTPNGQPPSFSDSYDPRLELEASSVKIYKGQPSGTAYDPVDLVVNPGSEGTPSTFSFTFPSTGNGFPSDTRSRYYVTYRLLIKADAKIKPGVTRFPNTATITIKDTIGDISYSDDAEVEYGRPIVKKEMKRGSNTTVNVEIIVNPNEETLALPDGDGKITVTDTMKSLAFIDPITVTKENDDELDSAPTLTYNPETNSVTFAGLPDRTAIKIKYTALVIGDPGDKVNIANQIEIKGYDESVVTVEQSFVIAKSSATSGGDRAAFSLLKTDKGEETLLPGAVFALYIKGSYSGWNDSAIVVPPGLANPYNFDGVDYYYIMSATTSLSGTAVFNNANILTSKTFLLVEIQAPAGYVKSEDPLLFYMRYGAGDNGKPSNVTLVIENGGTVVVTNEAIPGGPRFPETGAPGSLPYTVTGAAAMLFALSAALLRAKRRRRFNDSA